MSESRLVIMVGLPGSGKSTWAAENGVNAISSDAIRKLLVDDENDQTVHLRAFKVVHYLARQRLELFRPVTYIDATSLTRRVRRPFFKLARETGATIEALWFDVPLGVCKERNAARSRVVPEHVLDLMAARLIPPSYEEGFAHLVRV